MGNPIPQSQRRLVKARAQGRCERCGGPGSEVHHRQRRREGGHGIENLVLLCAIDHRWAHANPEDARREGYIVSTSLSRWTIADIPIFQFGRAVYLSPEGIYASSPTTEGETCETPTGGPT
jgi:hypothetical protein